MFAVDTTPPVITCVQDTLATVPIGTVSTPVSWVEPTATDESGVVSLTSRSHAPGSSFAPGTTTVTYVFTDGAGNSATCSFNVIVLQSKNWFILFNCVFNLKCCRAIRLSVIRANSVGSLKQIWSRISIALIHNFVTKNHILLCRYLLIWFKKRSSLIARYSF